MFYRLDNEEILSLQTFIQQILLPKFLLSICSKNPLIQKLWLDGAISITAVTKRPITAGTGFKNSIISLVENLGSKVIILFFILQFRIRLAITAHLWPSVCLILNLSTCQIYT